MTAPRERFMLMTPFGTRLADSFYRESCEAFASDYEHMSPIMYRMIPIKQWVPAAEPPPATVLTFEESE